jgi:glycosyltransferase involved in cell wall biosynthesis
MSTFYEGENNDLFVESIREANPEAIAIFHPEWRGIRSSMQNHVEYCFAVGDDITPEKGKKLADLIASTRCKKIVYGALPLSYAVLIRSLATRHPDIEQFITWHGSFLQSNEPYNWEAFKGVLCLCKEGSVKRIGFVKKGMEQITKRIGIDTAFYSNYVRGIPEKPSTALDAGPHLGIWAISPIWRKNPFAMLAATSQIDGATVHIHGQDEVSKEFAELFAIQHRFDSKPIPMEKMHEELGKMNLNLYVTLSECAPMTPLESLSVGVPCLLGPNSHYFEDWKALFDPLVVKFPDRAAVIAEYIDNALANRSFIVSEYAKFAVEYNARAVEEFQSFID